MKARIDHLDRADWSRAAAEFSDYGYRHVWEFAEASASAWGHAAITSRSMMQTS